MDLREGLAQAIHKALGDVTGIYDTDDYEDLGLADEILAHLSKLPAEDLAQALADEMCPPYSYTQSDRGPEEDWQTVNVRRSPKDPAYTTFESEWDGHRSIRATTYLESTEAFLRTIGKMLPVPTPESQESSPDEANRQDAAG